MRDDVEMCKAKIHVPPSMGGGEVRCQRIAGHDDPILFPVNPTKHRFVAEWRS